MVGRSTFKKDALRLLGLLGLVKYMHTLGLDREAAISERLRCTSSELWKSDACPSQIENTSIHRRKHATVLEGFAPVVGNLKT